MQREGDNVDPKLDSLLYDLCEGRISPEAHAELLALLAESEHARRRYVETVYLSVAVTDWAQQESHVAVFEKRLSELLGRSSPRENLVGQGVVSGASARDASARKDGSSSGRSGPTLRHHAGWIGVVAASLLAVCLISVLWPFGKDGPDEGVTAEAPAGVSDAEPDAPEVQPNFVAHVLDATQDVTWTGRSAPFDLLLRLSPGERISIQSGVLRLKYFSGAEIILHGPSVFTPTGPASGHLVSGRITGTVRDVGEAGFRLSTPNAEVIDLGTVFGVAVGESANTDVCVFDGEVEVITPHEDNATPQPIRLKEGMSLRLAADGLADLKIEIDRDQFLRELPEQSDSPLAEGEVSLVDAFIRGPGMSHRLVATLDPNTGKPDEQPSRGRRESQEIGYRRAVYNEFLDGVIIPPRGGRNTQLDSYGNTVDLPWILGRTYGAVWARRPLSNWSPGESSSAQGMGEVWGVGATREVFERLTECRLGMIGIHADVGLTFDLHAIQSIEGRSVERFRCVLANLDDLPFEPLVQEDGDPARTDVHVFVDGVERFVHVGLDREEGDQQVDIKTGTHCRVLTVVATDTGRNDSFGEVVLIDPTLELAD